MKKTLIFLLAATFLVLTGCRGEECEAGYIRAFDVKNATSRTIVITTPGKALALAPGETETVNEDWSLGLCNDTTPMTDMYAPDELIPFGTADTPFGVAFDSGEKIPDQLMQRRHWTFETNGYYHCTYTLTVTDALIASLPAGPER